MIAMIPTSKFKKCRLCTINAKMKLYVNNIKSTIKIQALWKFIKVPHNVYVPYTGM